MKTFYLAFGFFLVSGVSAQQTYVISTFAGGAPPPTTPVTGSAASITPIGVATDGSGNVYFGSNFCVFKLDQNGVLTRVAGIGREGYSGDGGSAINAALYGGSMAVDGSGNLYVADNSNSRVRKVSPTGIITTIAGNGVDGYSGDNGPATSAGLPSPYGIAVDGAGNTYISDGYSRVRKISPSGIISTVAGSGTPGFSGDGGPATSAGLHLPAGVAVDGSGNLYIADTLNNRVRKVSPTGIITTVAGGGSAGLGDGGQATDAELNGPTQLAVDSAGSLYILGTDRVRKVSLGGVITTVAGGGSAYPGDGGPATNAKLVNLSILDSIAVDGAGDLYITDFGALRKVSPGGIITTVAGPNVNIFNGLPGGFSGDNGPATSAQLRQPSGVVVDNSGNAYIADYGNNRIRKVSPAGLITTLAGNGVQAYSGDGGPAVSASLNEPSGVAVDSAGNVYIADYGNNRIRKVSPAGIISTVAGNGTCCYSGDNGPATTAALNGPSGVTVSSTGSLYIADSGNARVREVSSNGTIFTAVGGGTAYPGDGGFATGAELGYPVGVAVDAVGDLYIADAGSQRIRKVPHCGGGVICAITTVAGNGTKGYSGDGGQATSAQINSPSGIAVDVAGNLYIADGSTGSGNSNNRVRKVSPGGQITTVAGNSTFGYSGDGGPAMNAQFSNPIGVTVDGTGNLYVADWYDAAVRVLRPISQGVLVSAVVDAASESAIPVSPGKIAVIYGGGLGPSQLLQNQPSGNQFGTQLGGTTVSFNGIAAPILYTSATQVAAIVPYEITGTTAQVNVAYQGQTSSGITVPIAASAPSLFTYNGTGAGQAAAINAVDGTVNTAANPVKVGSYISLFATGEGQTTPAGVDGELGGAIATHPNLSVTATVGGIAATVQYAGGVFGDVAGLMQVNVLIPPGVQPGGYVPVVLQVGNASTVSGAIWIAVGGN